MIHHKRTSCRACGGSSLSLFLSLGPTPLANSFLRAENEFSSEARYPLDVYFCESCSLVQLLDVINSEVLFRDYIYLTGTSDTIASHNQKYADDVVSLLELDSRDRVYEIGSNDGSLLKCFQHHNVRTLGIEPATNIAAIANADGIETVNEFFNQSTAGRILDSQGSAKAIIGNNVLAHVDESQDFLRGCKQLLTEDGLVIIEVPYLRELIDRLEYDTIYHEHLCYFSVSSLLRLCDQVGLSIIRIDFVPVHGGSLRMYAGMPDHRGNHAAGVLALAEGERRAGLTRLDTYERFSAEVEGSRRRLLELLGSLRSAGKTIAGYGAPAKGNTLLNYCQIGAGIIPFTVDKSPLKVGLFTPGMHIPVLPVRALLENRPDYVLILAWNFAEEIMGQQQEYRDGGGRFIIPIPEPKVV
jgi:SAM-dependent methyltransferase